MAPTFIDLFSGAGLFSAGMKRAGFKPALAIELDLNAVRSYRRNVSDCIVHGSVAGKYKVPHADVVIAGPPCQGFSTLGRCDPSDVRNELSLAILPWAKAAKPQVVVIENVPPFVFSSHWKKLASGLRRLDFDVTVWTLEASDFDTPQRRKRSFTIASRTPISPPKPYRSGITAGEVLLNSDRPFRRGDPMHIWPVPTEIAAKRFKLIPPRGDKRDIAKAAPHLCPPSWSSVGCQATDAWGRLDPDEPANTIRCEFQNPSKGRYLHPYKDRVLSLREGARLQGVPDDWEFDGKPYPIARQIGNGVPISLAAAVGRSIFRSLT
ncbi:MAG: DNA cytosine methyltransferase [Rhizobiales bacterium]|nr:DNA cytosine methyltransferase [Hyphomicrobiales bacterium]